MIQVEGTVYLLVFPVKWGWMGAAATKKGLAATCLPVSGPQAAARAVLRSLRRGRVGPADETLAVLLARRKQLALGDDQPIDLRFGQAQRVLRKFVRQATRFFAGARVRFDLPLDLSGLTAFQRQALLAAREVPPGCTASYRDVARRAGRPNAYRAVGNAMAHNPLPLVIPCHRIIAADGSLGGFGGDLRLKERLLELERSVA